MKPIFAIVIFPRIICIPTGIISVSKLHNGGKTMDTIALILSIIGCLNWGLVGIFRFDLVAWLFGGQASIFSRIIYTIVGLAGLWCMAFLLRRNRIVDGE